MRAAATASVNAAVVVAPTRIFFGRTVSTSGSATTQAIPRRTGRFQQRPCVAAYAVVRSV